MPQARVRSGADELMACLNHHLVAPVLSEMNACPGRNAKANQGRDEAGKVQRWEIGNKPLPQEPSRQPLPKKKRERDYENRQTDDSEPVRLAGLRRLPHGRSSVRCRREPIQSERRPEILEDCEQRFAHYRFIGSTKT